MNNYPQENELSWSLSNMVGIFLTVLGVGVLLWVVVSLYLLFTGSSAFTLMDRLVPAEIMFSDFPVGNLFLPREFFVFGVPLAALSIGGRIGVSLLTNGVKLFEKPAKK